MDPWDVWTSMRFPPPFSVNSERIDAEVNACGKNAGRLRLESTLSNGKSERML